MILCINENVDFVIFSLKRKMCESHWFQLDEIVNSCFNYFLLKFL